MNEKVVDMTQGSIMPKLLRFALPVLLGMLCQRIYNFADVYIVGRYLGDEALASVSIAGSAMYLLMSMMMGITTGVSVVMSQYYGAGKIDRVKKGVNYAYLMNLACYGIFCPIVFLFWRFPWNLSQCAAFCRRC